jgi:hypothetical protein
MARYIASVETPRTRREVFTYLSDFSSTQEWDPGVHEADRAGPWSGRHGLALPCRRGLPRPARRTDLRDRRASPRRARDPARRERERRLARPDELRRDAGRRNASDLSGRAHAERPAARTRPVVRAGLQTRRRPGRHRTAGRTRGDIAGTGHAGTGAPQAPSDAQARVASVAVPAGSHVRAQPRSAGSVLLVDDFATFAGSTSQRRSAWEATTRAEPRRSCSSLKRSECSPYLWRRIPAGHDRGGAFVPMEFEGHRSRLRSQTISRSGSTYRAGCNHARRRLRANTIRSAARLCNE